MEEIIFTLNMPLKGAAINYFHSYCVQAILPASVIWAIELVLWNRGSKKTYSLQVEIKSKKYCVKLYPVNESLLTAVFMVIVWLFGIFAVADYNFQISSYIKNQMEASKFIEENYINPFDINITFPDRKPNIICIYMESAETTFQDRENGGMMDINVIPEMTLLAKENISFSQSELVEGAAVAPACGWTTAALVAQTAGIPIKLYTYGDSSALYNSLGAYSSFLPGVVSIGEILEREGYHNYFMAGSSFGFGGKTDYFVQHGNYTIWDLDSAKEEGKIPKDYNVYWGFEDKKLYEFAKEKLVLLAEEDKPFNFSMLTVDTHAGGGYKCELCSSVYDNDYLNVWACASSQVYHFVEWIKQQDFYENTVVYIAGDHCSMQADFLDGYSVDKFDGNTNRKVYNVFINSRIEPHRKENRRFTTMDLCPTILAAMGVGIEGDQIGLGTNLFSDKSTLAEVYGYESMFSEMRMKSNFYDNEILYEN
ncbi:MAG: LTA synthase family protein [Lachnospiraceae bacterium]|nr:LTA synthase family protein [Lachnospiraceae bacterium]MDE7205003.1 LTA synthase family protein [Lachnospiraceae bacterium]